jgi:enoyl-CoA hydratase/carnithine racemase
MHPPGNLELAGIFDEFEADPDQWVAILTGAGRAFSAGLDLKYTAAAGRLTPLPMGFAGLTSRHAITKPIVAAINGPALGGGFEAALACDIIVAADDAFFALPEPRVGLAALAGGLLRLPQSIGLHRALGIILTGRRVSAQEGFDLGFVTEVVPAAGLMPAAKHWASLIAECSPLAVRASKQAVRDGMGNPLAGQLEKSRQLDAVKAMLASDDALEGPRAFAEKRKPRWQGR